MDIEKNTLVLTTNCIQQTRSVDRLNEHTFKLSNKCSNQPINHDLAFKISADINKKVVMLWIYCALE